MSHIQKHIFIENDTKEVNKAVFILFEKCWCSLYERKAKLDAIKNLLVGHLPMISYVYE